MSSTLESWGPFVTCPASRPGHDGCHGDDGEGRGARTYDGGEMSDVPARALFHTAPRQVEIRDLPPPRPAAGEVLVRTLRAGISGGTERLVYRGEIPADLALDDTIDSLGGTFSYPFAYGSACVGEVAEPGPRGAESGPWGAESGSRVFAFHPHQDVFAAQPA